jgi:hypothetical protein
MVEYFPKKLFMLFFVGMVERFATKKDASLIKLFSFGSFQELEYF